MSDPAEDAAKILASLDTNVVTLARHHKQIFDAYITMGFSPDHAIKLLGFIIHATLGQFRK